MGKRSRNGHPAALRVVERARHARSNLALLLSRLGFDESQMVARSSLEAADMVYRPLATVRAVLTVDAFSACNASQVVGDSGIVCPLSVRPLTQFMTDGSRER